MDKQEYLLRRWRLSDSRSLAENANNVNIWNNVRDYFPFPYLHEDAVRFIKMANAKSYPQDFAIEVDGKAVGGIGYVPGWDVERLGAEIGYWLGEKYWDRGIMSHALREAVGYIFSDTAIIRLFTSVFEFNNASMRVLEKAGFRKIAIFKSAAIKNGKIIDMHHFELVKN